MVIDKLIEDLENDEGWREFVYDDATGEPIKKGSVVVGHPTIGIGFCVEDGVADGLPREIGDLWLEHAIKERWERLVAAKPWIADQPEDVQQALANMAYQMGVQGVLQFRMMLAALEVGDRQEAAREALNSRWAEQTPERAERVAALIRGSE